MSNFSTTFPLHDGYNGLPLDGYALTGNLTSKPVMVRSVDTWSIIPSFTGGGVGTFQIQVSNQQEMNHPSLMGTVSTDTPASWNWAILPNSAGATTFSTSLGSPILLSSAQFGLSSWRWMRLIYVRSSGSLSLTVEATVKSVNS